MVETVVGTSGGFGGDGRACRGIRHGASVVDPKEVGRDCESDGIRHNVGNMFENMFDVGVYVWC